VATKVSTTLRTPLPLVLTGEGAVVALDGNDAGASPSKRAAVLGWTVNAQTIKVLVRAQMKDGILFLDLCAAEDLSTLTTRVESMDLSTVAAGHPAPADDLIDAAALVDAAP
jgi:hypothetical protein